MSDYFGKDVPKLGFGLMRLPKKGLGTDVEQVKQMVDLFMEAGFTYFDTAFVYTGSEAAIKKALVDRYSCGTEQLYFVVPHDHRLAGQAQCTFSDMNGESLLMADQVGYWDRIVREAMPQSHFLLQNGIGALTEIIRASSLPYFATDLTIRLHGRNPERAYIAISDDAATEHFYCFCKREDEKKYLAWFQALERRF